MMSDGSDTWCEVNNVGDDTCAVNNTSSVVCVQPDTKSRATIIVMEGKLVSLSQTGAFFSFLYLAGEKYLPPAGLISCARCFVYGWNIEPI